MAAPSPVIRPPPRGVDLPYSDGEPMESGRHFFQMMLLVTSLGEAWLQRDDFHVGGNQFVYFSELQAKNNDFRGPDVFVVLDTVKKERKSWVVWEEGGRTPDVVIELLSESTEHVDRGEKMDLYARVLHVGEYFLFDPWTKVFEGYVLDPAKRRYRKKTPDADGYLSCEQLGLRLGVIRGTFVDVETEWLRWIDESGPLPTGTERAARASELSSALEQRAGSAEQRADSAEQRAQGLAERLQEYERRYGKLPP
jgi:Uma2 family endonuclease